MTLAESTPSACSHINCLAHFVSRIPAEPGNIIRRRSSSPQLVAERGIPNAQGTVTLDGWGLKMPTKEGVHIVHTLGFGFGCTGIGLGRTGDVFGGEGLFKGWHPVRVPPRARVFPAQGLFSL